MTGPERALARTEIDVAHRRIRQIDRWLTRPDLSPACHRVALEQKAEYAAVIRDQEAELAGAGRKAPRVPVAVLLVMVRESVAPACSCGEYGSSTKECDVHGYGNPEAMAKMGGQS